MSLVVALLYMRVSLDALNNVARREVLSCPNSNLVQKNFSCNSTLVIIDYSAESSI